MKKTTSLCVALIATCISGFALSAEFPINPKPWENMSHNLRVVHICLLTDSDLTEIMQGHHPETAVEFSAQTKLPISFFLKGDLANLIENEVKIGEVEIKQTFYARCVEGEFILSINLTDWKPFSEFITGSASVVFTIQEGKPSIIFGAETNRR